MLAYELFHNNKDSTANNPKQQFPIKKIFYKNNKIIIDKKGIEEYGSETTKNTQQLQDWLQMPLNTIDVKELNLPDFRTGNAEDNPYIEVYGYLKTSKSLETKLILSIGKKPNQIEHILDLTSNKIQNVFNGKTTLKLDKKKYFIHSNTLFSKYIASQLIDKHGILNNKIYDEIIQKFLEFAKRQKPDIKKPNNISFRLYILPDDSIIDFNKQTEKNDYTKSSFIDYFGNDALKYPSTPTKTAKFLTYDDKAFTINCMQGINFYKNLGIGNHSLDKVYTDSSQTFTINRLNWTFTDISNPDSKFKETKQGILTQLYENYRILSKDEGSSAKAQLKVICIRINQAKQELLIDENLTMNKMDKLFLNIEKIPSKCFEILIDNSNEKPIWDTYLYAVKNFLAGNKIPKKYLLSYFSKILKEKRYEWIKLNNNLEQKSFFERSDFCIKYLCIRHDIQQAYVLAVQSLQNIEPNLIVELKALEKKLEKIFPDLTKEQIQKIIEAKSLKYLHTSHNIQYMNLNEEFANKIGQIARLYIEFKQNDDPDNSLLDILTYSKYDRERLRFIVSRVGRGIQLSKVDDKHKEIITKKISNLQPKEEIKDDVASKDYSYFFFKGYYTNLEIVEHD